MNDFSENVENGLIFVCLATANKYFQLSIGIEFEFKQVFGNGLKIFLKVITDLISDGQMFLFILIEKICDFLMYF